jgi:hypothetical protein
MFLYSRVPQLPTPEQALRGRSAPAFTVPERHTVLGTPLLGPYPEGLETAGFGMGCFWGAERNFWQLPAGVHTTLVGYQGGYTENPTYEEVCSGLTGHTEAARVVYDLKQISYERLLQIFWESHNPTQGFRQGNDIGTQYRCPATGPARQGDHGRFLPGGERPGRGVLPRQPYRALSRRDRHALETLRTSGARRTQPGPGAS